jgi:hypothetical protein
MNVSGGLETIPQMLTLDAEAAIDLDVRMQYWEDMVEPQYTGFDGTPNRHDFPANYVMAQEAVRQGGLVTYGHPMFAGEPNPFGTDLAKPNGAARELPIDAVLGVVHAIDLMSRFRVADPTE